MIEGYCSADSVVAGWRITLHASTDTPGRVLVSMSRSPSSEVVAQYEAYCAQYPTPEEAHREGCNWPTFLAIDIPVSWRAGVYVATLEAIDRSRTQLYFVVRPPRPASPRLLCIATTTYAAYNGWPTPLHEGPGRSLYASHPQPHALSGSDDSSEGVVREVAFDRPNPRWPIYYWRWEERFVTWAEANAVSLDYCTSADLHNEPDLLHCYQMFISVGHDEYWSLEMRDSVEEFVRRGGNAAFFSGNVCNWQVRFGRSGRSMICYRSPLLDPLASTDPERVTGAWWEPPLNRPPNAMTGVSPRYGAVHSQGAKWVDTDAVASREDAFYTIRFSEHWVFDGVAEGEALGQGLNIVGYETDAVGFEEVDGTALMTSRDGTPENFVILATADLRAWRGSGKGGYATMGLFHSGGTVFTAATTDWSAGLAPARVPPPEVVAESLVSELIPGFREQVAQASRPITTDAASLITANVIRRLSQRGVSYRWEPIGSSEDVRSLAAFESQLYGISNHRLLGRKVTAQNVTWHDRGDASGLYALASTEGTSGRLIATDGEHLLWRGVDNTTGEWLAFDGVPSGTLDLACHGSELFALAENKLWAREPSIVGTAEWREAADAQQLLSLAAWNEVLVALRDDRVVITRPATMERDLSWQELCAAPEETTAIGCVDGYVVAVLQIGQLWWKPLAVNPYADR